MSAIQIIGAIFIGAGLMAELAGILRLRQAGLPKGEKPPARLMTPIIMGSVAVGVGIVFLLAGRD